MGFPWIDDAVSAVGGAVAGAVDAAVDAVVDAGEAVAGVAADVGTAAAGYAGDVAGVAVDLVDDTVFDGVDYLTGGIIDIDYDDGVFGARLGIDGVAQVGVAISEDGLQATIDAGLASGDLGISADGFAVSGSAGIDFGPLPYAEGHLSVSADGDVMINGHVQGTIPVPGGILSGQASGGFVRTDDGWGAYLEADGTYTMPSGTAIGGGLQAGYYETEDGSHTTFGVEGSISSPGIGSAGGSFGYERMEQDGDVIERAHAEGYAEGFGARIDAEADYLGIETAQGSFSDWSGDIDVEGLDADSLQQLGTSLLGLDDGTVTDVLGQVAAQGGLSDLLGSLDAQTTSALVERLVGAPPAGIAAGSAGDVTGVAQGDDLGDDVLGRVGASTSVAADQGEPSVGVLVADGFEADGFEADGFEADGFEADGFEADPLTGSGVQTIVDDPMTSAGVVEPAASEPDDSFSQSVAAADEVEADFDTMFDDLGQ